MLRPLRRLRYVLLPLYAAALLAFVARLGWAHDPTCPHHRGHAGSNAADAAAHTPASHASHAAHVSHAGHATHAAHTSHGPVAEAPPAAPDAHAPADSGQDSGDGDCLCLDPDCCLSGVVAVLDADTGDLLAMDASTFDAAPRPMPESVARPGAYRTHRLPFPHAPPGLDDVT